MDTSEVELPGRRTRRRHEPEFRARVVGACGQPGVSVAAVALANGLNANMVRKWVMDARVIEAPARTVDARRALPTTVPTVPTVPIQPVAAPSTAPTLPSFMPLAVATPAIDADIRIELQRGATAIKVAWPVSAAADCAAWLGELLR